MAIFSRGYEAMKKNEEKQKLESGGNRLWRLFLSDDGDEAPLIFLNQEPVNFYEHSIPVKRNGKDCFDNVLCTGADCDHCDDGNRPSPKSAWLVIDQRTVQYKDKDGKKKTIENQIRLLVQGTKFASICDRMAKKYGLVDLEWTLVRLGKGKQTSYTLERGDEIEVDEDDVRELLPDVFKDMYDGSEESVLNIIEKALLPIVDDSDEDEDEDDDDNELSSGDDDEDEEEAPKKKSIGKKKKSIKETKTPKKESKIKIGKKKKTIETKRKSVKEIIKSKNKGC